MDWWQDLIIQVGFSGSFEESKRDVYYRNDPMKYVDIEKKKKKGKKMGKKIDEEWKIFIVRENCVKSVMSVMSLWVFVTHKL